MICPTGAGAVVAVDVSTRSLRWGFKYPLGGRTAEGAEPWGKRRRGMTGSALESALGLPVTR